MEEIEYRRMADTEHRSWWFRGRRRILERIVAGLDLPPNAAIADIGCGTGGNLEMLGRFGTTVGVEPSATGAAFARRQTGLDIVAAPAHATTLPDEAFDLVTMLDVLEHLDDDLAGLREARRILTPGGRLLVTVPAFMFLWSGHDEAVHHRRRYRRGPLGRLLREAGLAVRWLSYFNTTLFPPVAAIRLGRRLVGGGRRRADGSAVVRQPLSGLLEAVFASERHVLGRFPLPFGVSLAGVAQRT